MTIEEWLAKPETLVTRREAAAFCEAVIQDQVRAVCQYVVDHNNAKIERFVICTIGERILDYHAQRWYRRLWRWIATFGHRPMMAPVRESASSLAQHLAAGEPGGVRDVQSRIAEIDRLLEAGDAGEEMGRLLDERRLLEDQLPKSAPE
jgi:hypothetical protein